MAGWLARHRLLVTVYVLAAAVAAFEFGNPSLRSGQPEDPRWFLDESNVVAVTGELYPDRAGTLYYRAFQASLCDDPQVGAHSACQERGPVQPGEIRELLERSLATGNRSFELAMYNYALVLLQEGANPADIDAAISNWRTSYPRSERPDPRTLYRELTGRPAGS